MTIPARMRAVCLTGHGGFDKLDYREDVATPDPAAGEVLIEVGACGLNNTDINTRTAWYSKSVGEGMEAGGVAGFEAANGDDSTWGGARIVFPRIQGADVVGTIVDVGAGVPAARMGERVLVDPWMRDARDPGNRNLAAYFGSERDGGYAEYTAVPAVNAFAIRSRYSDAELATFPCSYSTGEYILTRARLNGGETPRVFVEVLVEEALEFQADFIELGGKSDHALLRTPDVVDRTDSRCVDFCR